MINRLFFFFLHFHNGKCGITNSSFFVMYDTVCFVAAKKHSSAHFTMVPGVVNLHF